MLDHPLDKVGSGIVEELGLACEELDDAEYLKWFATALGDQLRKWRHLRFLHDYNHPGTQRWFPGHLYTLGENNVTLMAEFPDLDTGVFVDDDPSYLKAHLQLTERDIDVLRENYQLFHERDANAAATVVRSMGGLLLQDAEYIASAVDRFWRKYAAP